MTFLDGLFGNKTDSFTDLSNRFSEHQQNSEQNLHSTHGHLKDITERRNIDLKNVRKKGVKATAAAAILGAFLAIPHLIGHPSVPEQPIVPLQGVEKEVVPAENNPEVKSATVNSNEYTKNSAPTPPPTQAAPERPAANPEKNDEKSQGHTFGRSYMAPPKEHGFHDLGLHKGADKNPQVPDNGPHPEELGVNKGGDKS